MSALNIPITSQHTTYEPECGQMVGAPKTDICNVRFGPKDVLVNDQRHTCVLEFVVVSPTLSDSAL